MRKILLAILFVTSVFAANAQTDEQACHLGITFEISNNTNWGYGEPVVKTVELGSPADVAGVKAGDIIMEINGVATFLRDYKTIMSWLFDERYDVSFFTIRNLNTYFKEYELPRRCRSIKALDESTLASSFSFYSLENTQERSFVLPLKITTTKDVDYSDYHTFNFIDDTNTSTTIDKKINEEIEKALTDKGLVREVSNPDILIQTYYTYQQNVKYNPNLKGVHETWRYNAHTQKMALLPILSVDNDLQADAKGEMQIEFGIRFFDKKYISQDKATLIWEASTKEYAKPTYSLTDYVSFHAPLIMMEFPYATSKEFCKYTVSFKKYNYTGINYDMDDMKTIVDIDRGSPAYLVGMRKGMVVEKINNEKLTFSRAEIMEGYKRFFVETMKYRDPSTKFVDANGFPDCMYWNVADYKKIADSFKKSIYRSTFSYLYDFEKYVSNNDSKVLIIQVKDQKFNVRPEIKNEVTIKSF